MEMTTDTTDKNLGTPPAGRQPAGTVLVVGGGIAGIQAALDCADSGFRAYLLESQPAIGGNMARLDKTFPTRDCSMCMISPRLVEAARHPNVEIISSAGLQAVRGSPGHFTVSIRKRASFVSGELCNACGDCEKACPVTVSDAFNGGLARRPAISKLYPQSIPNTYAIEKRGISPCRMACPGGVNAHGYVALIAKGEYRRALDLIRETNPFAGSCGMVCSHPCENECHRGVVDDPIAICALKRFVFESVKDEKTPPLPITREQRVAIVGAGPAGLSCAYHLRRMGYATTVFESSDAAGGMLRLAIPDFRLPKEVVDRDVEHILNTGVELRLNTRIGGDIGFDQIEKEYSAALVACGAPKPRKLNLAEADQCASALMDGIEFLKNLKRGMRPEIGSRVAVVGGGNTALDAARSARRLGAGWVGMLYRRSREEMPAIPEEVDAAVAEGVEMLYLTAPARVNGKGGRLRTIECVRMRLGATDATGRRQPEPISGSEHEIAVDTLISAIGQYSDLSFLPARVTRTEAGSVAVDPETLTTVAPGVFAAGDAAAGPDNLIKAVAAGRRAAISMDRFLRGETLTPPVLVPTGRVADRPLPGLRKRGRIRVYPAADDAAGADPRDVERRAIEEAQRCLNCGACSECMECVKVCKPQAIRHQMRDEIVDLEVGAVILAVGYDVFDATIKSEYGFGRYSNVVTAMQFERMLSASGPSQGRLFRPSDGKPPRKIAWIQCVGSRDAAIGNDYCSSVCCMYAVKQAVTAREHDSDVAATIFFIDIRAFGKGYERFYTDAARRSGVRFARSQMSSLKENPADGKVAARYFSDESRALVEEEFDLVVLSTGLVASSSGRDAARICDVNMNRFGFVKAKDFVPVISERPGFFTAGAAGGPKDIPESVVESGAAAALCGELLAGARGTMTRTRKYPPEKDVAGAPPRIGVFVCHCGTNISSVIDVKAVADRARSLPGVVHAEDVLYACAEDTQKRMKEIVEEQGLNRVIVASCSPRTHESLFQETIREAGLNRFLFEMADIREQCAWVHSDAKDLATEKAATLVRGSAAKSFLLEPLPFTNVGVTRAALVIGGGISGMTAALSLARQGFPVHLVEKSPRLGGRIRATRGFSGSRWTELATDLARDVGSRQDIHVHLGTEVEAARGFVGNFVSVLRGDGTREIEHGVTVVATGAEEIRPSGFLHGSDPRVMTQLEFEERLEQQSAVADRVVMIQCVGCRDDNRPYCSRVCCGQAVKNAIAVKRRNPEASVHVLYRDIRTYGLLEAFYRQARDMGVVFVHFPDDSYPVVAAANGELRVRVADTVLGEQIELPADVVVLSAGIAPDGEGNRRLGGILRAPLDSDGFFMEAHVKLRPVDCSNEGIFYCGLAHSPKFTEENIVEALAAAGRAARILSRDFLEVGGIVAVVDDDRCATCLTCLRECPYGAPFVNAKGKAEIQPAKCVGCGNCAAACPAKAITLNAFTDAQQAALVRAILGFGGGEGECSGLRCLREPTGGRGTGAMIA